MTEKNSSAFTLAEVLITLAVIGVVAAMTLPVLIQKHQKMTWTNQLRATYSILNQGLQKMMADDEVDDLRDTQTWHSLGSPCSEYESPDSDSCKAFFNNLKKYFKIVDIVNDGTYHYKNLKGDNWNDAAGYKIILSNGAMIVEYQFNYIPMVDSETCNNIHASGGHTCADYGGNMFLLIDVNGKKGPNIGGRDVFLFIYTENGSVLPFGGKDHILAQFCGGDKSCLDDFIQNRGQECTGVSSEFCSGYLIEDLNWKMDY